MAGREGRRASREGRGLAVALLSLSALAVVAFLVGGLAGLVWKQPDLLFAHLTGGTREVAWGVPADPDADAGAQAAVTEEPPVPEIAKAAPRPPSEPAPREREVAREVPAVAAAPPPSATARIAVQVGAFAERGSAERLRGELAQDGFPAYVAPAATSGSPRWRVRVGPYASREDADRIAARLKSARSLPTWVLDEDAP